MLLDFKSNRGSKILKIKKNKLSRKWMRKNCSIILLLASETDWASNPQNCIFFVLLLVQELLSYMKAKRFRAGKQPPKIVLFAL